MAPRRAGPKGCLVRLLSTFLGAGIAGIFLYLYISIVEEAHKARADVSLLQKVLEEKKVYLITETADYEALKEDISAAESQWQTSADEYQAIVEQIESTHAQCNQQRSLLQRQHKHDIETMEAQLRAKLDDEYRIQQSSLLSDRLRTLAKHEQLQADLTHTVTRLREVQRNISDVEIGRQMTSAFGPVSPAFRAAYFDRLKRGEYREAITLNLATLTYAAAAAGQGDMSALWYINPEGEKVKMGEQLPDDFLDVLPKTDKFSDEFPRGGVWKSCAVVSPSSLLLRYRVGSWIDGHEAVFRFNDAVTSAEFGDMVGRKTTVRLVEDAMHLQARKQSSKEVVIQIITSLQTLKDFAAFKQELGHEASNLFMLNWQFVAHISRFLKFRPSHLYTGVALAMQKCRQVTLFGFALRHEAQGPHRYYDTEVDVVRLGVEPVQAGERREMALLEMLAQHSNGVVRFAEPCTTLLECYGGNLPAPGPGVLPLAVGASCMCDVPFPVPLPGYCSDASEAAMAKHAPASTAYMRPPRANCFRPCPSTSHCPGGVGAPVCQASGMHANATQPIAEGTPECPVHSWRDQRNPQVDQYQVAKF